MYRPSAPSRGPRLARSRPGLAEIGGPALVATMGPASRFATAAKFRSLTGLAPRASQTGQTDRKGQPISKAGNRLLRTTLIRAADNARRQDPKLARLYNSCVLSCCGTRSPRSYLGSVGPGQEDLAVPRLPVPCAGPLRVQVRFLGGRTVLLGCQAPGRA